MSPPFLYTYILFILKSKLKLLKLSDRVIVGMSGVNMCYNSEFLTSSSLDESSKYRTLNCSHNMTPCLSYARALNL